MSKFLLVDGDYDYGAIDFIKNFNKKEIYQTMIETNTPNATVKYEGESINIRILEFGEVDERFEAFIKNELCDYDGLKAKDIFRIE